MRNRDVLVCLGVTIELMRIRDGLVYLGVIRGKVHGLSKVCSPELLEPASAGSGVLMLALCRVVTILRHFICSGV